MKEQSLRNRVRESAKLGLRHVLLKANLDLVRDPWTLRVARTATAFDIDTVLDIGANVGQFGALMRGAGFSGRIISVEPLSAAYAQLAHRSRRDPAWESLNAAVGPEAHAVIHVSANSYSSSVRQLTDAHLDAAPDSAVIAEEQVRMMRVDDVVAERGVDPETTLLKVDTQGYEDAVFATAGGLMDSFAAVQVELSLVELYQGQRLMDDMVEMLRSHGLRLYACTPGISNTAGQMLQMDGLFVRERTGA